MLRMWYRISPLKIIHSSIQRANLILQNYYQSISFVSLQSFRKYKGGFIGDKFLSQLSII
jgi:hypothetical protein